MIISTVLQFIGYNKRKRSRKLIFLEAFFRWLKMFFGKVILGIKEFYGLHDILKNNEKLTPGPYRVPKFVQTKKRRQILRKSFFRIA